MTALLPPPNQPFSGVARPVPAANPARMSGVARRGRARRPAWAARGSLVVATAIAGATLALFARLHAIGFPIRGARLVDDHGASDDASMAADNTSAFNFRVVAGTGELSQHAFGRAIDINPVENPWIVGDRLVPPAGAPYRDRRSIRPGMIVRPGPVTAIFDELGWEWGGDWRHAYDLHHIVRRV